MFVGRLEVVGKPYTRVSAFQMTIRGASAAATTSYYEAATSSSEYVFISERLRYGDHLAHGHPTEAPHRGGDNQAVHIS